MSENLRTVIALIAIFGLVGGLIAWKLGGSRNVDDSAISEISDDLSAFERMKADVAKNNPIERDIIADIASEKRQLLVEQDSGGVVPEISEPSSEEEGEGPCSDMDVIYGKKGCKTVTVKSSTGGDGDAKPTIPVSTGRSDYDPRIPAYETAQADREATSTGPKEEEPHPFLIWKEINQSKPDKITGKSSVYPGEVIRAGCLVLAELENEIIAIPGREHLVVLNVRGALDGCKLPKTSGIRLVGKAKLTQDERYIEAKIETCSDRSKSRRSTACTGKAQVLSITGAELLEGWVYDESGMGILWESIVAIGMTPAIARLTQTAATAKTIFTAQTAQEIAGTMTKTLDRISQKIAAAFDGREIRITPKPGQPVTVQVLFSKDVIL